MAESQPDITQILRQVQSGDAEARDTLFAEVFGELRRVARGIVGNGGPATLHPTALVNEAYLRLFGPAHPSWEDRKHFFGAAARAMRSIVVDHARARRAQKRGGDRTLVPLDEVTAAFEERSGDVLALNEELETLTERDPTMALIVELRFFGGLSIDEVAAAMGMSKRTVERQLKLARAALRIRLGDRQ